MIEILRLFVPFTYFPLNTFNIFIYVLYCSTQDGTDGDLGAGLSATHSLLLTQCPSYFAAAFQSATLNTGVPRTKSTNDLPLPPSKSPDSSALGLHDPAPHHLSAVIYYCSMAPVL